MKVCAVLRALCNSAASRVLCKAAQAALRVPIESTGSVVRAQCASMNCSRKAQAEPCKHRQPCKHRLPCKHRQSHSSTDRAQVHVCRTQHSRPGLAGCWLGRLGICNVELWRVCRSLCTQAELEAAQAECQATRAQLEPLKVCVCVYASVCRCRCTCVGARAGLVLDNTCAA